MKTIGPKDLPLAEFHNALLTAVAPRPICFASTIDKEGNPNLSPFSFFNVFGSNPTTFIFSPAKRVRDQSIKHTLENVYETKEVVINVVSYAMVQQMNLASCEYPKGVNEFTKSGFTQVPSIKVKPFRVKESPVQFECKVIDIIETGKEGGAGNLIIAEMLLMHISPDVLTAEGKIDQQKMDLVGRMGSDWYVRASGNALFEVPKPSRNLGIGYDAMPEMIRQSNYLTANNLGMLANVEQLPDSDSIAIYKHINKQLMTILNQNLIPDEKKDALHKLAQQLLFENKVTEAWKVLLS
ncbi:MAG: flavin reductase family protein [Bacteroidota bacterium]|nr:flavin reductase family protein [Bacteroidota bacterium]